MSLLQTSDPLTLLADRLDPQQRDVFTLLGYTPTPKQAEFHAATEFDVLYGGAAGGGKTKALLMHGLRACDWYPGLRVGAFRRTYDELAESFFKELILIDYASELGCRWNGTDRELKFPNGSLIRFRYLETEKHATRRQGGEYHMVLIDERTLIPPAAVSIVVDERIRSGDDRIPVLGVRSGTNPGGIGHGAVKRRHIIPTDYGRQVVEDEQGRSIRFIQAKVDDNPHVDKGYKRRLEGISDVTRRRAMLDGDWDSFSGQYFPEWRHGLHVVRPLEIPNVKHCLVGIDWGYAAPWAVLWGARDGDGRVWLYREIYDTQVGEKDQARRILAAETPNEVRQRVADPSMWNTRGDAHTIADMYSAEGCHLTKAENHRISGWQRVHSYLELGPACHLHQLEGMDECPMLHVFDTCTNLVRTLPDQVHDLVNVEDLDTDGEDHAADALRYLLMQMGLRPPRKPDKPLDMGADARAERHFDHMAKRHSHRGRVRAVGG